MIPSFPVTADRVRRVLLGLLGAVPVSAAELARRGGEVLGRSLSEEVVVELLDACPWAFAVGEDAFVAVELLVEGWTITHRVSADEAVSGVLVATEDLVLAAGLAGELGELTDFDITARGGTSFDHPAVADAYVPVLHHPDGALRWEINDEERSVDDDTVVHVVGPAGWLEGLAGALVGFERRGRAWVWVGPVDDPALSSPDDPANDVERVAVSALRSCLEGYDTSYLVTSWWEAIQVEADNAAMSGLPRGVLRPVHELAALAGVSVRGQTVATAGYDWAGHRDRTLAANLAVLWRVDRRAAEDYGLLVAVVASVAAAHRSDPDGTFAHELLQAAVTRPGVTGALARPELTGQLRAAVLGAPADRRVVWEQVLEALEPALHGLGLAASWWLRSLATSDAARADDLLVRANRLSSFAAGRDEVLWRALCRGEIAAATDALDDWVDAGGVARAVLTGTDAPETSQVLRFGALEALRATGTVRRGVQVGRNDPCPCGSGRKYKRCHDGRPLPLNADAPLSRERSLFLHALLLLHCDRIDPMRTRRVLDVLDVLDSDDPSIGMSDDQVSTSALIALDAESGVETERFLAETRRHGATWSTQDEATVRDWAGREVSVFEVTDRLAGSFLRVRDLRTGDHHEVDSPTGSRRFGPGELVLGRVLPFGGRMRFGQGVAPVPLRDRDTTLALLDGHRSAVDLASWMTGYTGRFASRARVAGQRNTDGDLVVVHQGRFALRPNSAVAVDELVEVVGARLDEAGLDRDPSTMTWAMLSTDVNRWLRGEVALHHDTTDVAVDLRTNSLARYDELRAVVDAALRDVAVLEVVAESADDQSDVDVAEATGLDPAVFAPSTVAADGPVEVTAAMRAEIVELMAQRWCDTSVPALGGLTPRDAAQDPTRRDDLVRLLEDLARNGGGNTELGEGVFAGPSAQQLARLLGIRLTPHLPRLR